MGSRKEIVGWVAAAALVVVGAVTLVVTVLSPMSSSSGWFAYAPLSKAVYAPSAVVLVSTMTIVGAIILALGLAVSAFLIGWRLGGKASR